MTDQSNQDLDEMVERVVVERIMVFPEEVELQIQEMSKELELDVGKVLTMCINFGYKSMKARQEGCGIAKVTYHDGFFGRVDVAPMEPVAFTEKYGRADKK